MAEINFRSSMIKSIPQKMKSGRGWKIGRRGFIVIAIIVGLLTMVQFRILPRSTVTNWLYLLHDTIYLQIKGHTFTQYFPNSIIWWGVITSIVTVSLLSWFSDRSWVRPLHTRWLRFALRQPRWYGVLSGFSYFLRRIFWIRPMMLRTAVDYERNIAMQLYTTGQLEARGRERLAHLLALQIDLTASMDAKISDYWEVLCEWHLFYLLAQERMDISAETMRLIFASFDKLNLSADTPQNGCFSKIRLISEMQHLITLGQQQWQLRETNASREAMLALEQGIEERRVMLMTLYNRLEIQTKHTNYSNSRPLWTSEIQLLTDRDEQLLSAIGRLTTQIACHVAMLLKQPTIAQGYIEVVELLQMVLMWSDSAETTPYTNLLHTALNPTVYQLTASLAQKQLEVWEEHWSFILDEDNTPPVTYDNFKLEQTHIEALQHAARVEPE